MRGKGFGGGCAAVGRLCGRLIGRPGLQGTGVRAEWPRAGEAPLPRRMLEHLQERLPVPASYPVPAMTLHRAAKACAFSFFVRSAAEIVPALLVSDPVSGLMAPAAGPKQSRPWCRQR